MDLKSIIRADNELIHYLDDILEMTYYDERNKKKIFWFWLNKFEYLANIFKVPDNKMVELFLEMVNKNIKEDIKKEYPNVNFTEQSYEEIINHYINYFNYSPEILSSRKPIKNQNYYERKAIEDYAYTLRNMYNNSQGNIRLEITIAPLLVARFNNLKITKYLRENTSGSFCFNSALIFAQTIEQARYINPAISFIKIYNPASRESFYKWLNKFEYISDFINISKDEMLEFFNHMVHADVHKCVKQNNQSVNFSEHPYEDIINYYLRYFDPSNENNLHRNRFMCRIQYKDETLESYSNCLRKLSDKCSYTSQLDEKLCEQFLNGIRDDEIRTILITFRGLMFDETVEYAIVLTEFKKKATYLHTEFSKINIYNPEIEDPFYDWLNKFEYVVDVIGVESNRRVQFFKEMVHNNVKESVEKYFQNVNFTLTSYNETIDHYIRYLCVTPQLFFHRRRFMSRKQYKQETIKIFSQSLQKLVDPCCYGNFWVKKVGEQFRYGIYDNRIKTYIDKYPDLSFDTMEAIAIGFSDELNFLEDA